MKITVGVDPGWNQVGIVGIIENEQMHQKLPIILYNTTLFMTQGDYFERIIEIGTKTKWYLQGHWFNEVGIEATYIGGFLRSSQKVIAAQTSIVLTIGGIKRIIPIEVYSKQVDRILSIPSNLKRIVRKVALRKAINELYPLTENWDQHQIDALAIAYYLTQKGRKNDKQ